MHKHLIYVAIHTSPIFDESLAIHCIEYGDLIKTYNCSISTKPSNYPTLQKDTHPTTRVSIGFVVHVVKSNKFYALPNSALTGTRKKIL